MTDECSLQNKENTSSSTNLNPQLELQVIKHQGMVESQGKDDTACYNPEDAVDNCDTNASKDVCELSAFEQQDWNTQNTSRTSERDLFSQREDLKTGYQRTKETTEESSTCVASQTKDVGSSECSERKSKRLGEKRKRSQEIEKNDKGGKSNKGRKNDKGGRISSFRHELMEPEGKKVQVQPRSDMLWLNMMNGSSSEKREKTLKDASQRDGNYKKHSHKNAMPFLATDLHDKSAKINSRSGKDDAMQLDTLTSHTIKDDKRDKVTEAIDSVIKKARKYSLQTEVNEKLCKPTSTKSVKFNIGDTDLSFQNKPATSSYDFQKITEDDNDSPKETLTTNAEYKSTCQAVIGDNQAAMNEDFFPTGNGVDVNRDQPNNNLSNKEKPKESSQQCAPVVPEDRQTAAEPVLTLLPKPYMLSHQVQAAVPTLTQHAVKVLSYSGHAVPMLPHMPSAPLASQPQTYQTLAPTIIVQPGNVTSDSLAQAAMPFQADPIVQRPTQTQTNIQPRPLSQTNNSRGKAIQSTKFIPPATVSNIKPMVPGTSPAVPSLEREPALVNVSGRAVLLSLKEMVENGSIVPGKNVLSVNAKVCIHILFNFCVLNFLVLSLIRNDMYMYLTKA